jgi:CubicO group peptidase (beta-lactamase class C family)
MKLSRTLRCCILLTFSLALKSGITALRADEPAAKSGGKIAAKLQPFVDEHTLAGAVTLVANKDRVLDVETVGWADIAAKKPMQPDNLFWIASMSKPITCTAMMILVDEGKVGLDDPVEKYLPEFKKLQVAINGDAKNLKKPNQPITVRQILSHTSGMRFSSPIEHPTLDMLPLAVAVRSYAKTPLQTEPGTKWAYANAGINTGGRIIEVVSGMPYEDFLQQRLFTPLGMKDTTFWPNDEQTARLAKSYRPNPTHDGLVEIQIDQLHYPLNDHKRQPMPAGGLFSTAADLANFCRMILNNGELDGKRYVSDKSIREMTSDQCGKLPNGYGFGWFTDKKPGGPFGHGGAESTDMQIDPQKNLVLIYLVQHAGYANKDGGKILSTFRDTAREMFSK